MSDPAFTCHFLDRAAYHVAEEARMALGKKREADPEWLKANSTIYGWASLSEVVAPCAMWYATWYFDNKDPEKGLRRDAALAAIANGSFGKGEKNFYLSRFYWQTWSHIRPPICVLCPNGKEWCVDAKSSNGEGWEVTGDPPALTCSPSILVPGYHGHLRGGVFTPNM